MKLNPETLARASSRHPWRTVAIWLAILVAGIASMSTLLGPALTTDFDFTNSPEAKQAQQILEDRALEEDVVTETFVVVGGDGAVQDPAYAERVNALLADLTELGPKVIKAVPASYPLSQDDAADPQVAALGPIPSEDGTAVLFTAVLTGDADEATKNAAAIEATREASSNDGIEVFELGQVSSSEDFKRISEEDLRFGEGIGVLAAIIVLIIVFGAVVAGLTPIVMGIFSIIVTLGIVGLFGIFWRFSFFTPNLISMMGLAVGIDYSLFIVSRYREERHKGREKLGAIAMAGATANRAVFFSGLTVVLALAGMLLVPTTIFRSLAGGAIIVVLVSVAASMTLLPAILSLLGDKINAGRIFGRNREIEHGRPGGFWDRITRVVMGRPVVWLVLGTTFLVVLSLPYWFQGHPEDDGRGIKTGLAGIGTLPEEAQTKRAFDEIVAKFPKAGGQSSAEIVIVGDGSVGTPGPEPGAPGELGAEYASAVDAFESEISDAPNLGQPAPAMVSRDGTVALIQVPLTGDATDAQSEAAVAAIAQLRETYVPRAFDASPAQEVLVGGDPAFVKDFFDISDRYNLPIILLVLALSFVLLTIVFRSLVVPIKAIIMNLLSVGAAYGLIVAGVPEGRPGDRQDDRRRARIPAGRRDRGVAAAVPLLDPVRPVDGLPRVPDQPDPRGVRPDPRQRRGRGLRAADDRWDHHRRGDHHGGGLRRVRGRAAHVARADGVRPRGGGLHGRDDRAVDPRAVDDASAWRPELVPPGLAPVAAEGRRRGPRGRRPRRRHSRQPGRARRGRAPRLGEEFDDRTRGRGVSPLPRRPRPSRTPTPRTT